jgi:hypothetical protein
VAIVPMSLLLPIAGLVLVYGKLLNLTVGASAWPVAAGRGEAAVKARVTCLSVQDDRKFGEANGGFNA